MKKILLILLFLCLGVLSAQAQSRNFALSWNPNAAVDLVTSYTVSINGTASVIQSTACTVTTCSMNFSVTGNGPHTVTVLATNQWGNSAPTSITFSVVLPAAPGGLVVKPAP